MTRTEHPLIGKIVRWTHGPNALEGPATAYDDEDGELFIVPAGLIHGHYWVPVRECAEVQDGVVAEEPEPQGEPSIEHLAQMGARQIRDYALATARRLGMAEPTGMQRQHENIRAAFGAAGVVAEKAPEPQVEPSDAMTGEIRALAFEDGKPHGIDCGLEDCECPNHDDPPRRAGTYITIRLDGEPRIGMWRVRVERMQEQEGTDA